MSFAEGGYSRSHFSGLAGTEGKRGFGLAVLMAGDDWAGMAGRHRTRRIPRPGYSGLHLDRR
jgi:hypothetical protein